MNYSKSICFDCIRSAAPKELRCCWDDTKGKKIPEGAKYILEEKTDFKEKIKVIIKCPLFLSIHEKENKELLKNARRRKLYKGEI